MKASVVFNCCVCGQKVRVGEEIAVNTVDIGPSHASCSPDYGGAAWECREVKRQARWWRKCWPIKEASC